MVSIIETFLLSSPSTPPTSPSGARDFNSLEHHQQVSRGDLRAVTRLPGQLEPTALQTLVPDPQTGSVERQDLQAVTAPVPEHEQGSRQRILLQPFAHRRFEPVEGAPHIDGLTANQHPRRHRQRQHAPTSSTTRSRRKATSSNCGGIASVSPSGHRSSKPPAATTGDASSGT